MVLIWWRLANHTHIQPAFWLVQSDCTPNIQLSLKISPRRVQPEILRKGQLCSLFIESDPREIRRLASVTRDMVKTRHVCPGWPVSKLLAECQLEWLWHCLILLYVSLKHHYHSTVWQTAVKLQGQGIGKPLLFLSDTLWFQGGGGLMTNQDNVGWETELAGQTAGKHPGFSRPLEEWTHSPVCLSEGPTQV